jgi:hypothetical protein
MKRLVVLIGMFIIIGCSGNGPLMPEARPPGEGDRNAEEVQLLLGRSEPVRWSLLPSVPLGRDTVDTSWGRIKHLFSEDPWEDDSEEDSTGCGGGPPI